MPDNITPQVPLVDRSALEQAVGGYQPKGMPEPLPMVPHIPISTPLPRVDGEPTPMSISAIENSVLAARKGDPRKFGGSTPRSLAEVTSSRYDNFVPGDYNNEDAYAQGQGWTSKMVNGVGKGLALTAGTFLQSTLGLVNGVGRWKEDGRFASFYDNPENRAVDDIYKKLEDILPNYYTDAEKNASWYSGTKLFSANFLWDGIVKNMGFAAGAALAGNVYAGAVRGLASLPGLSRLVSVGKGAEVLAAQEQALLSANAASSVGKIKSLSDKFLSSYNFLSPGGRAVVAGLATTGEAGFEAFQNLNQYRNEKIQEWKDSHGGLEPMGQDLADINAAADGVGNSSLFLNTVLLTATNYIQFPRIIGSSYRAEKGITNAVTKEIEDVVQDASGNLVKRTAAKEAAKGFAGRLFTKIDKIRPYTFSASEAFEEGAQYAIGQGVNDYYNKKAKGKNADLFDSLSEGIRQTIGTNEGMENVLIGGLSGALMQARGKYTEARDKAKDTATAIQAMNNWKFSDFTKETIDSVARGTAIQEDREGYLRRGDILNSKDAERDYIINYLTPRIKYGRFDLVRSDIEEYKRIASTEDGFDQLVKEGKVVEGDTREGYLQRINNLETTANDIKSLYQSLNLRYGNIVGKDGKTPLYTSAVIDKMIYAATKVADYDNRIPTLSTKLVAAGIDVDGVINNALNEEETAYDAALAKIDELDKTFKINADEKQDLLIDLSDINELTVRRKAMLQEYADLKTNPAKYQEVITKESSVKEKGAKSITIPTKDGDVEFEIGKEYFAGAPMRKSKEGVFYKDFSRFTILGETEDGKLLIKTVFADPEQEGETFEVDKDYFQKQQIEDVSTIGKRPNAKFYIESAGTTFDYKLGAGETVRGTIRYNRKTDKLQFVSTDGKQKFTITRGDFAPRKGYKEAKITPFGKLTAKAQDALNEELTQEELQARIDARDEIVVDAINFTKEKLQKVDEELAKAKEDLVKTKQEIDALSTTKDGKPRKGYVGAARKALNTLSAKHKAVEETIASLEDQKEELTNAISYLEETYANREMLSEGYKDLVKDLEDDISAMKEMVDNTEDAIKTGNSLLESIKGAIATAISNLDRFIADLKAKNPNTPLFLDDLQTRVEKYLGEEGAKQFIADKLGMAEIVAELQDLITGYGNDLNIPNMNVKSEKLSAQIGELITGLDNLISQQKAKAVILKSFEQAVANYEKKLAQEEKLKKSDKVKRQMVKTQEKGAQTKMFDKNYEEDARKPTIIVPRATKVPSEEFNDAPLAEHHIRANEFGVNFESFENKDNIRGVIVTSENENEFLPGLTQFLKDRGVPGTEIDPKETIALVMVEENPDTGELTLLGVDGQPIDKTGLSGTQLLEKAIFQVYPAQLKWSNGSSMFRKGTDTEVVDSLTEQYEKWRKATLKTPPKGAYQISPSFGIPEYVTYLEEVDGEQVKRTDFNASTSVEDAGLITNDDLLKGPIVKIHNFDTPLEKGSTYFEDAMGMPFLELPNAYVRLKNRKLTEQEAENVYQAIYRLSKIMLDTEDINSEEAQRLLEYLRSVVYWGVPREGYDVGANSVFFSVVPSDGLLDILKLFIQGEEQNISFTPSSIQDNKEVIINLLEDTYNNVNSKMTAADWNQPYEEVLSIADDGTITTRDWPNYQSYLLSKNLPDENGGLTGGVRSSEELPLSTPMRPLVDENDINRKGVYFTVDYGEDVFNIPKPKKKKKAKLLMPGAPRQNVSRNRKPKSRAKAKAEVKKVTPTKKSASKKAGPAPKQKGTVKIAPEGTVGLDGETVNKFETKSGRVVYYFANAADIIINNIKDGLKIIWADPDGKPLGNAKEMQDKLIAEGETKEASIKIIKDNIINSIKDELIEYAENRNRNIEEEDETEEQPKKKKASFESTFNEDETTSEDLKDYDVNKDDTLKKDLDAMENDEDPPFRLMVEEQVDRFEGEDWNKAEKWLAANLPPGVSVFRVKNILKATGGRRAWGMFQDAAVYIYENAEVGTVYHEVFHAIWRMFLSPEERKIATDEFRSREGEFFDRTSLKMIKYSEATEREAEERLAEELRDFIQFKKNPPKPGTGKTGILKLFAEFANFVKRLFLGRESVSEIDKLFKNINTGYYKQYSPYDSALTLAKEGITDIDEAFASDSAVFSVANFTSGEVNDIMQEMTYQTIGDLIQTNKGLFNIPEMNKGPLYEQLRVDVRRAMTKFYKYAKELIDEGGLTKEKIKEAERIMARSLAMRQSIMNDGIWESLVNKHEQYLRKYNIEFDENDVAVLTDEDATNKGDWQNADQIDSFRKANSAIKFLLSTLPIVEEVDAVSGRTENVPSSIGGVTLLSTPEVFIKIMNTVNNSRNVEDMLERIKQMGKKDVNYRKLYYRLTKTPYNTEGLDLSNLKDKDDWKLLGAFWTTFKKQNPSIKNHYILENGEAQIGDGNFATAARQEKMKMITSLVKVIKGKNPYFKQDYKTRSYVGVRGATRKYPLDSNANRIAFLKSLGIAFKLSDVNKLKGRKLNQFKLAVNGIKNSIEGADKISTITGKILGLDGRLLELAEVRASIENPEFDSTFYGINGQKKQTYIGTNAASDLYDALSQVNSLNDIPELFPQYAYLLTDSFAEGSVILNKMFNMKSSKKERIYGSDELMKTEIVDGTINQSNGKIKESSKLTSRERFIQEINLNLAGDYLNLVPGDASLEWMMNMGNHITTKQLLSGFKDVHKIFRNYFISELKLVREDRPVAKDRNTKEMRFFKGILGPELHQKVIDAKGTPEAIYDSEKFKADIEAAVERFIKAKTNNVKNLLRVYDVIKLNDDNKWDVVNLALPVTDNVSDADLTRQLTALTTNYIINNIELHKLLYSDPYQYADELKRIKNFTSPGRALLANSPILSAAYNKVWNEGYNKKDIGYFDFTKTYLNSATLEDVVGVIDLEGYDSFEETDGGGIITLQAYRAFRLNDNNWNDDEERQYKYDIAWEKTEKGKNLSEKEKAKQGLVLSEEEQELYEEGNPKVKSAYTPIKPIVRGNKGDGKDYNDVMLDKFALYPLSYRIVKTIANDSKKPSINAMKLYDKMQREDINYVVFKSGRKVGSTGTNPVYNKKTGEFNEAPYKSTIKVPWSIINVQAEVPSKDARDVTMGSQMTKLVTMDLMEAGVPVDFEPTIKDINKRYTKWYGLKTQEAKEEASPLYKELKANENLLSSLIQSGYEDIIRELGIKETDKGYRIDNIKKVVNLLRDEFLKREINDNIISALDGYEDGDVVIEATPAYQQIRNILYSIADRSVVSKKISGGQKVQISSTFFEDNRMAVKKINGKEGYTSEVLNMYSMEKDGKQINVCEIMIGRWFDSDMSDADLLEYLNNTPEGQKILSGAAFRIPTQKQNSIDVFKIKQFLPYEFGDSVVIPAALVKKVGSDFDIDKLSVYLKNVFIDKFGKPKLIEFLTDENSTAEERYFHWVISNSSKDAKKYVRFLSKPIVGKMKGEFANELAVINSKYPTAAKEIKERAYKGLIDLYNTELPKKLTDQESYLYQLFDKGRDVFFSLADETRADYWELKRDMAKKGVKGPEEIRRYLSLTLAKIEDFNTDQDDVPILEDMAKLYEEELRVLGATEDYIKEYKTKAVENFRKYKNSLLSALTLELSGEANNVEERYRADKEAFDFEYAKEVASMDELKSFEDFEKLSIYDQNTSKALQNQYIQSLENIVRNPFNYKNLIKPNSAKQLKDISDDIVNKLGLTKFDYSNPENMLDREFMFKLRHAFVTGKYAIGIAAVNQTNHSLNQRQLLYFDLDRLENLSDKDAAFLGDAKFKFFNDEGEPDFNTIEVNGKDVTTLSMIFTKSGEYISDVIGQLIDGYVDIAKDPWIIQLGALPNVASTFMLLIKAGVPVNRVMYFMNQPIIRDYLRSLENAGYTWLFNDSFVKEIKEFSKYKTTENLLRTVRKIPSEDSLYETLGAQTLTPMQRAEQQFILDEFLKYSKLGQQLFYVTQGSNFDTANFNDPTLVYKKEQSLIKARGTILASLDSEGKSISAVDGIINNSFLKALREHIIKTRNALSTILMSDRKRIRNVIQNVLYNYVDNNDRDFVKIAQKVNNDLFDWVVQTDDSLKKKVRYNTLIEKALIGDNSYVQEINDFIEDVRSNPKHALRNNQIIKSLQTIVSDKFGDKNVNNLKFDNKENKTFDQNQIIHGFNELKNYLKGSSTLYNKIKAVAVIQSGLANSPISFTNLLPYEDFKEIYNEILSNLETMTNLELFNELDVFERNNWSNDDIVPRKKQKIILASNDEYYDPVTDFLPRNIYKPMNYDKTIPMVISIPMLSREGESDIIVYQWEDQTIPYNEKQIMKQRGDYSYIKKGLFKKVKTGAEDYVYVSESKGNTYKNYIYKAINAWGDGFRANEFYKTPTQSKIDNGFIKVKEVSDDKILPYFIAGYESPAKKSKVKKSTDMIQPDGKPAIKNSNKNNCG